MMRWSDLEVDDRPAVCWVIAIVLFVAWIGLGVTVGDPGLPADESLPTSVYVVGPPVTGAPVATPIPIGETGAAAGGAVADAPSAVAAAGPGAPVTSSNTTPKENLP